MIKRLLYYYRGHPLSSLARIFCLFLLVGGMCFAMLTSKMAGMVERAVVKENGLYIQVEANRAREGLYGRLGKMKEDGMIQYMDYRVHTGIHPAMYTYYNVEIGSPSMDLMMDNGYVVSVSEPRFYDIELGATELLEGRLFDMQEMEGKRCAIIFRYIGLGEEKHVGDSIALHAYVIENGTITGEHTCDLLVVGVVSGDQGIYVPYKTFMDMAEETEEFYASVGYDFYGMHWDSSRNVFQNALLKVDSIQSLNDVCEELSSMDCMYYATADSIAGMLAGMVSLGDVVRSLAVFFFVLAIAFCFATSAMKVIARKREIGTFNMLGLPKEKILGQFLVEMGLELLVACVAGMRVALLAAEGFVSNLWVQGMEMVEESVLFTMSSPMISVEYDVVMFGSMVLVFLLTLLAGFVAIALVMRHMSFREVMGYA